MFVQHLSDLSDNIPELVRAGFISQLEGMVKPALIAHRKIFETDHCKLAVRDRHDGSFQSPDPGRAEADILDGTDMVSCPAQVTHVDRSIRDYHDTAE